MMTILMIDVEGGKEDLFEQIIEKLNELKEQHFFKQIQVLYLTKCYTHSDISFMVDVKDPEILPTFITKVILPLDGVWDIQIIPLLNPNFFQIPKEFTQKDFNHTKGFQSLHSDVGCQAHKDGGYFQIHQEDRSDRGLCNHLLGLYILEL
jgi:hypothetical protein